MERPVVNIRIEVDPEMDDRLEAWAMRERRSKREQVAHLVEQMLKLYETDPLVLQRLQLQIQSRPLAVGA